MSTVSNRQVPSQETRDQLAEAGREIHDRACEARHDVQEKAKELGHAVTEGAAEVWHSVRDAGDDVRDRAAVEFHAAQDLAGDYVDEGRERLRELGRTAEGQIRSQPLASVLVAVGAGFLLGALWNRR